MRLRIGFFVFILALFSLSFTSISAQDGTSTLASLIDQRAAANGLPSGDGNISAAEQSLSSALINEITGFDELVTGFEAESSTNSMWVEAAEQAVQNFNQKITTDPRAEAISNAVDQYGIDADDIQAQAPIDPRAEAISNAVDQYGNEPVIDPRGQAISDAVDQYDTTMDPRAEAISRAVEQYGQQILDPRAEAISHAVAQYGLENGATSYEDQQRMTNTVRESASEYIDQAGVKRPGITKRHVNHLIQWMVPNAMLPINGYWRIMPFSVTTNGNCIDVYGDNDGPPVYGEGESDPGMPLCGYANAGALPFILWNGMDIPYLPGSSSIYSQVPQQDIVVTSDRSGASTGSLRVTTTTEYEVVAPDRILVHLLIQEEGGCSMSADYMIELVTADESVCPAMSNLSTPEPTPEPPEVVEGPYTVGLPLFNDEEQCNETNSPPEFDEVRLLEQPDGSVIIDYGTGTQVVYNGGDGFYQFESGGNAPLRLSLSLVLFGDGTGSLSWSGNSKDGNICFVSRDVVLPGAPSGDDLVSTPVPDDPAGESGDIPPAPALTTGNYTVTWSAFPGMECTAELDAILPKFSEATLTASGAGYTLDTGGTTYELTEMSGQYMSIVFESDNSGVTLSMFDGALAALPPGHWGGTYTYFAPDASMCMSQLDFAPAN